MIVAIDGPAGSGKSTVARALARRCGLTYLDTGAMYRTVALACERRGCDLADAAAVTAVAQGIAISFGHDPDHEQVFLDGQDVSADIRTAQVDRDVSVVSGIPAVRQAMVEQQRAFGAAGDVVAEGRDIGSVVFPQADVKVFLTAGAAARAHRRAVEREGGDTATGQDAKVDPQAEQAILADIERRDKVDSSRASFKLEPVEGATVIDSSDLTVEQVVDRIAGLVDAVRRQPAQPAADAAAQHAPSAKPAKKDKPARSTSRASDPATPLRPFAGNSLDDYYERPMRAFPWPARAFLGISMTAAWAWTKVFFPWKVEQAEKLWQGHEPGQRGRVIVMNHASMLDPVVVAIELYHHHIRTRPISKSEFDKVKLVAWAFSRYGCIPVVRGTADIKAVRRAQRALQAGDYVLVFPEGTRIKSDEDDVTVHGGFALMAQLAHADVQPMAIVGARDITPRGHHFPRPSRVYLKVGDPISFDELGVGKRKQQAEAMEKVAMERVYALRDELRAEHPGKM